jgi:cytochrome c5
MADAHVEEHSTLIKTPKQLVIVIVLSFLIPVLGILLLVQLITGGMKVDPSSTAMSEEAVASRLKPVGEVALAAVSAAAGSRSGKEVYASACAACHDAGLLNAPKPDDRAAWKARLAQGQKTLVSNAINGIRQMPARGGNASLTDLEVERAVVYMANQAGGKLTEPAAASAPAAAAGPAPAAAKPAAAPAAASAPAAQPSAASAAGTGEKVYNAACQVCHSAGLAGAPKTGDKAAWKPRIAQGIETLHTHAIQGIRTMPAKGGAMGTPDADIKAAVDYMVARSR